MFKGHFKINLISLDIFLFLIMAAFVARNNLEGFVFKTYFRTKKYFVFNLNQLFIYSITNIRLNEGGYNFLNHFRNISMARCKRPFHLFLHNVNKMTLFLSKITKRSSSMLSLVVSWRNQNGVFHGLAHIRRILYRFRYLLVLVTFDLCFKHFVNNYSVLQCLSYFNITGTIVWCILLRVFAKVCVLSLKLYFSVIITKLSWYCCSM